MNVVSEQLRTVISSLNEPSKEPEPIDVLTRRKALRILIWGGMGVAATVFAGWSIYEQNAIAQQENPWAKLEKLGPNEIYLYSGTATLKDGANLFSSPPSKDQIIVPKDSYEAFITQHSSIIPPSNQDADPQKDAWVGIMTNKGLLFTLGGLVTIEGGSFIKALKTDKPNEFKDIATGAIITTTTKQQEAK